MGARTARFMSRPLLSGRAKTDKLISHPGERFFFSFFFLLVLKTRPIPVEGEVRREGVDKTPELRFERWAQVPVQISFSGVGVYLRDFAVLTLIFNRPPSQIGLYFFHPYLDYWYRAKNIFYSLMCLKVPYLKIERVRRQQSTPQV